MFYAKFRIEKHCLVKHFAFRYQYLKWAGGGGEGLIETGGLLNLEITKLSVLHKEIEGKVEKLNYKKF